MYTVTLSFHDEKIEQKLEQQVSAYMATQESQYVETLSRILQVKDRIFLIYDYEESS